MRRGVRRRLVQGQLVQRVVKHRQQACHVVQLGHVHELGQLLQVELQGFTDFGRRVLGARHGLVQGRQLASRLELGQVEAEVGQRRLRIGRIGRIRRQGRRRAEIKVAGAGQIRHACGQRVHPIRRARCLRVDVEVDVLVAMHIVVRVKMAVAGLVVGAHVHGRDAAGVDTSLRVQRHQLGRGNSHRFRHGFSHHHRRRLELNSTTPQQQRALHQGAGVMRARCAAVDGIDPSVKFAQCIGGEAVQRGVDARVFGQARVVDLLTGPRGVAEVAQADHARAALERVEGAAHQRDVAQPLGVGRQVLQRLARLRDDLARFFDEDAAHLGVVFQAGLARRHRLGVGSHFGHGGRGRCFRNRHTDRELADGLRQVGTHRRFGLVVDGVGQRLLCLRGHTRELGFVVGHRALRELLKLARKVFIAEMRQARSLRQHLRFLHQRRALAGAVLEGPQPQAGGAGCGDQAAFSEVKTKQRARQHRLHAEHVDEETQRAQVVGQALEVARLRHALKVDFGARELVHRVAHVRHGQRALFEVQHREHAAHGPELRRHRQQELALAGVTEVLVDLLFDVGERHAQLVHHAAHGLAVADAAVELFNPGLQRLHLATRARQLHTLRHQLRALGQSWRVELTLFDDGVKPQHRRGHLHGQRRARRLARGSHLRGGRLQRMRQRLAGRQEPRQRVAQQGHRLGHAAQAADVATGHGRPNVSGADHAFARLRDHRRVKAAQAWGLVVGAGGGVA